MEFQTISYELKVNGKTYRVDDVEPRMLLADVLRDVLGLTGTHLGCEHGVCGACTVLLAGLPARSCLVLGNGAQGQEFPTVEGIAAEDEPLPGLPDAFWPEHGVARRFCRCWI